MISKYWTWAALLLLGLLSLTACEKDKIILESAEEETHTPADPHSFVRFNWSEKEARFFSLDSPIPLTTLSQEVEQRTGENMRFHPLTIDAFNHLALQNEVEGYIDDLVDHMGLPFWEKSVVYVNEGTQEEVILIPFFDSSPDRFSGLLSVKKQNEERIINGISRASLLLADQGDAAQRLAYAEWMLRYQEYLLGTTDDEELKDAYCHYRDREETEGRNPPPSCEWILVEMCSDLDTQTSWIGGHANLPPHLDHDQDGILNEDDQDWHEFLQRYGITQENWTAFVYEYWETHHADEGDYEEYWGNGYYNWDDYETIFQEMWDDWWDEWFGPEGPDDTDWGPYPDPDYDPPIACWEGGGLDQVDDREVRCMFVYLLYCEGADVNWWESADIVVCDGCSDQDLDDANQQQAFYQRLQAFIQEFNLQDHESLIYSLVQPGDFPVLGNDEIVNEILASILLAHFSAEHPGIALTNEEESWLIGHPEIIGELLMASEITGPGQYNEGYLESFIQVAALLELDSIDAIWLLYEQSVAGQIQSILQEEGATPEAVMASKVGLLATMNGVLNDLDSEANLNIWAMFAYCLPNSADDYDGWVDAPDANIVPYMDLVADEMAFIKLAHPDWSNLRVRVKAEINVLSDGIHTLLDICGLVEGVGLPCDVANGVFYALEGDGANATMSFAGALPGGVVVTSGRVLRKVVTVGNSTRRFTWRLVGNNIAFSHGSTYRKVWKGVYPALNSTDNIAHHVIPQARWQDELIQKAARANPDALPDGIDPFHMNMPANGWPVHTTRHTGNHQNYSNQIFAQMEIWNDLHPNATPEEAAVALAEWQVLLKNTIGNATNGPNINTLTLPPIP